MNLPTYNSLECSKQLLTESSCFCFVILRLIRALFCYAIRGSKVVSLVLPQFSVEHRQGLQNKSF